MPNKFEVATCPNPGCRKKIEEPILLNNFSTNPAEQYQACPYCFVKLDAEVENDRDIEQESISNPPSNSSLGKVLNAISAQTQEEEEETEKEEVPKARPPEKKEKSPSRCPHHHGYLASRARDTPIPPECLTCPKIVDCMLRLDTS